MRKEPPMTLKVGGREVEITHPDKILFPKSKITKGDLVEYYRAIAPLMVPMMKDRPVSMLRYPNGITGEGFFQKNVAEYFPSWIKTKSIARKEQESIDMLLCNDAATLVYLANQACITPHIWLSRSDKLRYPDRLIFDLDPPSEKEFAKVMEGAKRLREVLEKDLGLKAFVMTTGSKGLHVVVPLKRDADFDEVRAFARKIGELLAKEEPDKYTIEQRLNKRKNRIFIDYLRNAYAQTGVAPYAVRAIEGAPVAMPVDWSELKAGLHAQKYTIKNSKDRLKKDPWAKMNASAKSLKRALVIIDKMIGHIGL